MNSTQELVPIQETVALPITVEEAKQQWEEYQRLTQSLLHETDYQKIGNRQFKKKSAWRKYARAFNITDRVTYEHIERAEDGFPVWARLRVEASHPNGRSVEADHECHVKERCCEAATGTPCVKKGWRGHTCCALGCTGRTHWSHPGDLPATALTRAKNRAISDLIGAGEVSAEELSDERERVVEGEVTRRATARRTEPQRPANVDQDGVVTEPELEPTVARTKQDLKQWGSFTKPNGSFDSEKWQNTLKGTHVTADALKKHAPMGGSAWLKANPGKTLDDLLLLAAQEEFEEPDVDELEDAEEIA